MLQGVFSRANIQRQCLKPREVKAKCERESEREQAKKNERDFFLNF